jgi:hypothetical protein
MKGDAPNPCLLSELAATNQTDRIGDPLVPFDFGGITSKHLRMYLFFSLPIKALPPTTAAYHLWWRKEPRITTNEQRITNNGITIFPAR